MMQRKKIIHRTYYLFSEIVTLGRHSLRLYPREGRDCRVESFSVSVNPFIQLRWYKDVEDNSVAVADFSIETQALSIETECIIQQYNDNPFDFLLESDALNYPLIGLFQYSTTDSNVLAPYRILPPIETQVQLIPWIGQFWQQGEMIQSYTLLERLNKVIYTSFAYAVRDEPGVQSTVKTLSIQRGCCRDFSLLFMEVARCLGFAARFVSGYLQSPPNGQDFGSTHAWVEVYLPGAGWKGFDPTAGLLAGEDNIAIAVVS